MSTVDHPSERMEFLQGTLEVLILREPCKAGPNHAYGIGQFLETQSGNEFVVGTRLALSGIAASSAAQMAGGAVEDLAQRTPRPLLPADAAGTEAIDRRAVQMAAICGGDEPCAYARRLTPVGKRNRQ